MINCDLKEKIRMENQNLCLWNTAQNIGYEVCMANAIIDGLTELQTHTTYDLIRLDFG